MEPTMQTNNVHGKWRLSNYNLLMISVLSGLGGVLSTYIGYLGNLLNRLIGVPFGAGQFVSGLHVFWIILVAGMVKKPGAATAAGLIKGIVELFTGSTHGIVIVLVSLCQGFVVDIVLFILRKHNLFTYCVAGGLAAASNVIVFQTLYFSGAPIAYLALITGLALLSGILFAGSFGNSVLELLSRKRSSSAEDAQITAKKQKWKLAITGVLSIALSIGAIVYFVQIYEIPWGEKELRVEGAVALPLSVNLQQYSDAEVTVLAELRGQVTYVPEQQYTGIPLPIILAEAQPLAQAQSLLVIASDGYQVEFSLSDVMQDDKMILSKEDTGLRLIAGNYEGGYWVRQVTTLRIQ